MSITIDVPYRNDVLIEDWCIQNLTKDGHLRVWCKINDNQTIQIFIFENEIDATAFKLRWA